MVTPNIKDGHIVAGFNQLEWQQDRDVVPAWLNAAVSTESYARVDTLIEDLLLVEATMNRGLREKWFFSSSAYHKQPKVPDKLADLQYRSERIRQMITRYSFTPVLDRVLLSRQWVLWMSSSPEPDEYCHQFVIDGRPILGSASLLHREQTVGEADVVLRIANLAVAGELDRIRHCAECGKWFYADRSHQKFCSGAECRVTHYRKSTKHKNYRKKYMRDRRAEAAAERAEEAKKLVERANKPPIKAPGRG